MARVLITGGAGFIGCALCPRLADAGHEVVAFDSLHPQVHAGSGRPTRLDPRVELIVGDVRRRPDIAALMTSIQPEIVVHLAAETGTGQSLAHATRHASVNVVGTTQLLDALYALPRRPEHIILASSRAVYGEGLWRTKGGVTFAASARRTTDLERGRWTPPTPDGTPAWPLPASAATTPTRPTNIYGATKFAQEQILDAWTPATGSALSILRLQNVYGRGQSLTNSYTGIVALFSRLAASGAPIPVYEDGDIVRDFVAVEDVTAAIAAALARPPAERRVVDIGSGQAATILEVARLVADISSAPEPVVTSQFRPGDVRAAHCDITAARAELAWTPTVALRDGLANLAAWVAEQETHG